VRGPIPTPSPRGLAEVPDAARAEALRRRRVLRPHLENGVPLPPAPRPRARYRRCCLAILWPRHLQDCQGSRPRGSRSLSILKISSRSRARPGLARIDTQHSASG
jgi:hypothetical protein